MSEKLATDRERESRIGSELLWLTPALLAGVCIFYFYLQSHAYPAFGAGLYSLIAERISENGYALPFHVPYYTSEGVPFAYPPLMFYVVAALRDLTGADPITIARFLPGFVTILYLVPFYLVARELLGSRPQAVLAGLIVAVGPPVLQWHISAGGIVRAPAFLFALSGIYAGIRLFRDADRRWFVPTLVAFALTVLTHPVYTLFLVSSVGLLYLRFDRTLRGLGYGLAVGVGGAVLTAPWWVQVMAVHGVDVFAAAAGTHGGIGEGVPALGQLFDVGLSEQLLSSVWQFIPIAGSLYLLSKRRYLLPLWLVVTTVVIGKARFPFLVGALIVAAFILDGVAPWVRRELRSTVSTEEVMTFSVVLVATIGLSGGALYATSHVDAHAGSPSLPQFVDGDDVEAMAWVANETAESATFVVQSDAAEWFPQQTHRTMLVGPWGVEWKGQEPYRDQLQLFKNLSWCNSENCITGRMRKAGLHPDYVYVARDEYTVRGIQSEHTRQLELTMLAADRYEVAYKNDDVLIFEVTDSADSE